MGAQSRKVGKLDTNIHKGTEKSVTGLSSSFYAAEETSYVRWIVTVVEYPS